jgi:hypothetical protein
VSDNALPCPVSSAHSSPKLRTIHWRIDLNRCVFFALSLSLSLAAAAQHNTKETQEDIARHRAMAAAHEAAAKCLESGKKHDQCQKDLQAACKGLALGKSCGMKHSH